MKKKKIQVNKIQKKNQLQKALLLILLHLNLGITEVGVAHILMEDIIMALIHIAIIEGTLDLLIIKVGVGEEVEAEVEAEPEKRKRKKKTVNENLLKKRWKNILL